MKNARLNNFEDPWDLDTNINRLKASFRWSNKNYHECLEDIINFIMSLISEEVSVEITSRIHLSDPNIQLFMFGRTLMIRIDHKDITLGRLREEKVTIARDDVFEEASITSLFLLESAVEAINMRYMK